MSGNFKSTEFVNESSGDEESSDAPQPVPKRATNKRTSGASSTKKDAETGLSARKRQKTSDSSSNSSPNSDDQRSRSSDDKEEVSSSEDEVDADEESANEEEDEGEASQSSEHFYDATSRDPSPSRARTAKSRRDYIPKDGFERSVVTSPADVRLKELLSSSDLSGKQMIHIIAPSQVPVEALIECAAGHAGGKSSNLSHGGFDYTFTSDAAATTAQSAFLLVPNYDEATYETSQHQFTRTLRLRKVGVRSGPTTPSSGPQQKKIPSQPEGLRTRYWPAGFEPEPEVTRNRSVANTSSSSSTATHSDRERQQMSKPKPKDKSKRKPPGKSNVKPAPVPDSDDSSASASSSSSSVSSSESSDDES